MHHSEPAIKQMIKMINESSNPRFIFQDLDETHLLINKTYQDYIKKEVEKRLETNFFEPSIKE